jgi:hypothetical protein
MMNNLIDSETLNWQYIDRIYVMKKLSYLDKVEKNLLEIELFTLVTRG